MIILSKFQKHFITNLTVSDSKEYETYHSTDELLYVTKENNMYSLVNKGILLFQTSSKGDMLDKYITILGAVSKLMLIETNTKEKTLVTKLRLLEDGFLKNLSSFFKEKHFKAILVTFDTEILACVHNNQDIIVDGVWSNTNARELKKLLKPLKDIEVHAVNW